MFFFETVNPIEIWDKKKYENSMVAFVYKALPDIKSWAYK